MTTPCEVILYADKESTAAKVAADIETNTFRLEKKYNFFSSDSLVSAINTRDTNRVKIDSETLEVLTTVRQLSIQTGNIFDITAGTLKQCRSLDSVKAVEACQKKLKPNIGIDSWKIEGDELVFSNPYVQIDLGGVIKEYAVDQGGAIADQAGLSALINFGGDIYVNGTKPGEQPFTVAIKNPKNPQQKLAIVQLQNQGLTTSAHYERSTKVQGKHYSHIIGEEHGTFKIISATIISSSVLKSGIYSTSLMLNPTLSVSSHLGIIMIDEQLRLHQNIFQS